MFYVFLKFFKRELNIDKIIYLHATIPLLGLMFINMKFNIVYIINMLRYGYIYLVRSSSKIELIDYYS